MSRLRRALPALVAAFVLASCSSASNPGADVKLEPNADLPRESDSALRLTAGYEFSVTPLVRSPSRVGPDLDPPDGWEGKVAIWEPEIGVIILGPEETGEPLAHLILDIGGERILAAGRVRLREPMPEGFHFGPEDQAWWIRGATFSTTDVRVGTALEMNGKLYELEDGTPNQLTARCGNWIRVDEVYREYVVGSFCVAVDRVRVGEDDPPESLELQGSFVALEVGS
ncbi:MAG TPA: hypothetical protein VFX65_03245 [Candidatus Limnocylindrales bacterium]|nr:hypothetical protein [Candidatus Limnocylindrales bacterium]